MRYLLFIISATLLISGSVQGQLVTSTSQTPSQLMHPNFFGSDYIVSNVSYSGSASALGSFNATGTNLGLNEGLIMTTGTVLAGASGPHGPNNQPGAGVDNGVGGYVPLSNIAGAQTYNAARLEFDIVGTYDTLLIKYVFASEEYLEYVNSGYNDPFGIFISGPGINGQQIISTLPSGEVASIDNIHSAGTNANGDSFGAVNEGGYVNNNAGSTLQYDGLTIPLWAVTRIDTGQVYHITIAIADAGDGVFDSGFFIENCLPCFEVIGTEEMEPSSLLECYPNPSSNEVHVTIPKGNPGNLVIYDIYGAIVQKIKITTAQNDLSVKNLKAGVYYFSIEDQNKVWRQRVVIQ